MELAPNSGNILQVEFLLVGAEIDVVHLDGQESLDMKEQAFTEIQRRAREAVPALSIKHLTYLDDEGDSCTLTKETLIDALSFASSPVEGAPIRILKLHIHSPDIDAPPCQSGTRDMRESVAKNASTTSSQLCNPMSTSAEVHAASCDSCRMNPILGLRFKSLLHDDFNLCQRCFSSAQRQPQEWVQVATAPGVDEASCSKSEAVEISVEELEDSPQEIAEALASIAEMQQDIAELTKEVADIDAAMVSANSTQADEEQKEEKELEEPEQEAEYEEEAQNEEQIDDNALADEEESQQVVKFINLVGEASLRLILGKCGQTLKEIRRESGASVVLKPAGRSFDARIAGTKEQAESAEKMIRYLIAKEVSEIDAATVNANSPQEEQVEVDEPEEEQQQEEEEEEAVEEILETETSADREESEIAVQAIAKAAKELAESALAEAVEEVERRSQEKEEEIFKAGTTLLYRRSAETEELLVNLVKVHYDDHPPYYTIRMPDGREKQTIGSKLTSLREDVDVHAEEQDCTKANISEEISLSIENAAVCKKAIERLLHHPNEEVRKLVHETLTQVVAENYLQKDTLTNMMDESSLQADSREEVQMETNIDQVNYGNDANKTEVTVEVVGTVDENNAVDESVPRSSAKVIGSEELVLGIEAWEDASARGDATSDLEEVGVSYEASQVYRIGRMMISASEDDTTGAGVPVSARLQVANDGECDWPESTALVHRSGPACDCSFMQLGELKPGEATEISMDLLVPLSSGIGTSRSLSIWTIADSVCGKSLGPALCFEVFWE